MALRLSELLERIRPAGTPGAAASGDEQSRHAMIDAETRDIASLLAEFEREADELMVDARREADQLLRDGERRTGEIRAGLADRVAIARAAATGQSDTDAERDAILASARRDADHLRHDAAERLPALVDMIVDSIWSALAPIDTPTTPVGVTTESAPSSTPGSTSEREGPS